jgi:hypothetical protein
MTIGKKILAQGIRAPVRAGVMEFESRRVIGSALRPFSWKA